MTTPRQELDFDDIPLLTQAPSQDAQLLLIQGEEAFRATVARLHAAAQGLTGPQIVALLAALTGGERDTLAALAVGLVASRTGEARLSFSSLKDLPAIFPQLTGPEIVGLLQALTGEARLDASAVKNLPSGSQVIMYLGVTRARDFAAVAGGVRSVLARINAGSRSVYHTGTDAEPYFASLSGPQWRAFSERVVKLEAIWPSGGPAPFAWVLLPTLSGFIDRVAFRYSGAALSAGLVTSREFLRVNGESFDLRVVQFTGARPSLGDRDNAITFTYTAPALVEEIL